MDTSRATVRVEYCLSPDMLFLDTLSAGRATVGPVGIDGAVALKRLGLALIPKVSIAALDAIASLLASPRTEVSNGILTLHPGETPALKYVVSGAASK